jgi:hypothetical protein
MATALGPDADLRDHLAAALRAHLAVTGQTRQDYAAIEAGLAPSTFSVLLKGRGYPRGIGLDTAIRAARWAGMRLVLVPLDAAWPATQTPADTPAGAQ